MRLANTVSTLRSVCVLTECLPRGSPEVAPATRHCRHRSPALPILATKPSRVARACPVRLHGIFSRSPARKFRRGAGRSPALHFSSHVGRWRHRFSAPPAAALHANLQPAQNFGGVADGIVSTVQTVEPARMILLVKAFRPHEQVQVSECTLNFDGFVGPCGLLDSGDRICNRRSEVRGVASGFNCGDEVSRFAS